MANINLSVGQINITDNLVVRARKVATPLVEETREVYSAPLPASFNVVLPASGSIDPVNYYVDFYESSDGVTLDLLLAQFVVKARNELVSQEIRFYEVGGSGDNDPAPDQSILSDPYLDGKTIAEVYRDGVGRPLVEPGYAYKEYDLYAGGGIELLNGQVFSLGEKVAIVITYLSEQQASSGGGLYEGVTTITTDTTLDSTYRNKRLRCVGNSSQLVITLEDVMTVPDGAFYHFTHNNGNQFQTKIVAATGQSITYYDTTYPEMSISPGEYLRIEKTGSIWEATLVHHGFLMVGERFAGTWESQPNTKLEDGTLYDGDDWPRIWYWLNTFLPLTHKVIDDNVINGGYTHPVGKEGLFVLHSTLKKFRVPNTQGFAEHGLESFSAFNTDSTRTYDYPGGSQPESIGPHTHDINARTDRKSGTNDNIVILERVGLSSDSSKTTENNSGTKNRVKNIGVVYLRRF